ncbi:hypothetical protein NQ318_004441 [Aromia moschata]|uniref:X-box-binding protein 1 n=1 Tax=Aromia moschata TaxID=1265417 RepID=A0AAV8XPJ7_9CUCU|nr:hypothetical protein NQ318_004441 [Aromia moschata]
MMTTIPAILKYLSNNQDYTIDQNMDVPHRAKKRRLDHLSWEEKMQRKKLKNRVAAQTSRDRKKAKMDQMEKALQQLFSQNENLLAECESLKLANQRLTQENSELCSRLQQTSCPNCSQNRPVVIPPSAERKGHSLSSGFGHPGGDGNGDPEANTDLPSLPDLLDELNTDVDINSLEQLTQSLLEDIARDLENAAQKTENQESASNMQASNREVVGTTSKELESDGCEVLKDNKNSLETDISEYLLLHHNYAAKPPSNNSKNIKKSCTRQRMKAIRPKLNKSVSRIRKLAVDHNMPIITVENDVPENIILDDSMNCVTFVLDHNGVPVRDAVTEVSVESDDDSSRTTLAVPSSLVGSASPASTSSSDFGYESLDSPNSSSEMDLWEPDVSELFPSLM